MDTAMDLAQQRVVYASEAHHVPSHIRRYLCPCCFEKVNYRNGGLNRAHFAHTARNDFTTWCEKRVDSHGLGNTVNPLLVKSPFPIYLYKHGDYYQLQVRFRPISERYSHLSDRLIKIGNNYSHSSYRISNFIGRFHSVVLNYIPRYDSNIIGCSDSNVISLLNQWGRFIDYFGDKGALFKKRDGRKVRSGGVVYCGSSYYYVSIDKNPPNIECTHSGFLTIGLSRYPVYSIVFSEDSTPELLSFCDSLHIHLLEQRAEPRVLWPPLVLGEDHGMCRLWKESQICLSLRSSTKREIWEEGKTIQSTYHVDLGSFLFINSKEDDIGYNILQSDMGDYLHFTVFNSIDTINQGNYEYCIEMESDNQNKLLNTNFTGCAHFINKYNELFVKPIGSSLHVHCPESVVEIYLFNRQNVFIGLINLSKKREESGKDVLHRVDIIAGRKVHIPLNFRKSICKLSTNDPVMARMLVVGSKDNCVSESVVRYLDGRMIE